VDRPDVGGISRRALGGLVGAPAAAARLPELVEQAVDRLISIDIGLERIEESLGLLSVLPELAKAVERVDRHVVALGESVDGLERRVKSVGRAVAPLDAAVKRLDDDLKTIDQTVGRVHATATEIRGDVGTIAPDVAELGGHAIGRLVLRIDQLHATLQELKETVEQADDTASPDRDGESAKAEPEPTDRPAV
jgi:exonuclease VII small subunit